MLKTVCALVLATGLVACVGDNEVPEAELEDLVNSVDEEADVVGSADDAVSPPADNTLVRAPGSTHKNVQEVGPGEQKPHVDDPQIDDHVDLAEPTTSR